MLQCRGLANGLPAEFFLYIVACLVNSRLSLAFLIVEQGTLNRCIVIEIGDANTHQPNGTQALVNDALQQTRSDHFDFAGLK